MDIDTGQRCGPTDGIKNSPIFSGRNTKNEVGAFAHRQTRKRTRGATISNTSPTKKFAQQPNVSQRLVASRSDSVNEINRSDNNPVITAPSPVEISTPSIREGMDKLGFIRIPITPDGKCCYNAMATVVNIHSLLSGEPQKKVPTSIVIDNLKSALTMLLKKIDSNRALATEISTLLQGEGNIAYPKEFLTEQLSLLECYDPCTPLAQEFWGNSRCFGLLGLIYGFQIDRYVLTVTAKKSRHKYGTHRASKLCTSPENFEQFPEIIKILSPLIKGNPSKKIYTISFDQDHFEVWLKKEQVIQANEKLSSTVSRSLNVRKTLTILKTRVRRCLTLGSVLMPNISSVTFNMWHSKRTLSLTSAAPRQKANNFSVQKIIEWLPEH